MQRPSPIISFAIISFLIPRILTWYPTPVRKRGFVHPHFATTNNGNSGKKDSSKKVLKSNDMGAGKNKPIVIPSSKEVVSSGKISSADKIANQTSFDMGTQQKKKPTSSVITEDSLVIDNSNNRTIGKTSSYDIGLGKNRPVTSGSKTQFEPRQATGDFWVTLDPVQKPNEALKDKDRSEPARPPKGIAQGRAITRKRIVPRSEETKHLKAAVWHEDHYAEQDRIDLSNRIDGVESEEKSPAHFPPIPTMIYPRIDLSIPDTVYSDSSDVDVVWDNMRYEAFREAKREPLLVSFLHSTILNHKCLESALAFHLANSLSSPAMISTQIQALILEALQNSADFRKSLRADMMAVRDRDPACNCLPDVFLYFKGFLALQTHRVAHYMYKSGRQVLAHYLQSQVSQHFQIDIHPNATIGLGVMMDHGTGIVVGETARVGHNCSILHHVTLGGSGRAGVDRHPKVGDGVLLGAGCSVLGNIKIGDGCQIGAGTLVISDLPPHSVAVGVPAKIIGSFVDVTQQPSIAMNQMTGTSDFDNLTFVGSDI